jgi:hypothetical protein
MRFHRAVGQASGSQAIQRVTGQAANADVTIDEALAAGLDGSDRIVVSMKMLRAELLSVKADLARELERAVLGCTVCGRTIHYVSGLGARPHLFECPHVRLRQGGLSHARRRIPGRDAGSGRVTFVSRNGSSTSSKTPFGCAGPDL